MIKTVIGSFDSFDEARQVVRDLKDEGFMESDISIVASNRTGDDASTDRTATPNDLNLDPALTSDTSRETSGTRAMRGTTGDVDDTADTTTGDATGAATGAVTGGVLGGAAGVAVSLMGLAIPGIGPIIAAGPIVAGLTGAGVGAVAGGLIGGLTSLGVSEEHAEYYAESVRRGGALVTIRCDESRAERAAQIMQDHGAVDIERRVERWRDTGWTGYDRNATASTGDMQTDRDRDRTASGLSGQGLTGGTSAGLGLGASDVSSDRSGRSSGLAGAGSTAGTMGASASGSGGGSGLGSSGASTGTGRGGTMSAGTGSVGGAAGLGADGTPSGSASSGAPSTVGASRSSPDIRSSGASSGMGASGSSAGLGASGSSSGMGTSGTSGMGTSGTSSGMASSSSGMGRSGTSTGLGTSGTSSGMGTSGSGMGTSGSGMGTSGSSGMGTSGSSGMGTSGSSGLGTSGSSAESALTGGTGRTRAQSDWNSIQDDFRREHDRTYAGQNASFDDYAPAYRHGYESAQSDTYRGRSWEDVEPNLRSDWERRNPGSTWERMKDAVRRGWDRLTGDNTSATSASRDTTLGSASIDRNRS